MNIKNKKSVLNVKILNKEYKIGCSSELESSLLQASKYLDRKMRDIRDQSHVVGLDKIAVLAALHITHELLQKNDVHHEDTQLIQNRVQKLTEKISQAIAGKSRANKHQKEDEFSFTDCD